MTVPARITVKVKPRGSKNALEGWEGDALIIRLTAPPVDGAANNSLIRLLAKKAGVPRSSIRIVSGERGRSKILEFEHLTTDELKERLR